MATYYVSATGLDTNSGTDSAHPWLTITKVNATTLAAGDSVLFKGGDTFTGNLLIQNSGTALSPITISSYGVGKATISPGTSYGIQVKDCDYVHISNLTITGPGVTVSGSTSSSTTTASGIEVITTQTQAAITTWRTGLQITNVVVSGCYNGINCHSHAGSAAGPYPIGFDSIRITSCVVHDCLDVGIHIWSNNVTSGNYIGIENGTSPYHKNCYIGYCYIYNIYGDSAITVLSTGNGILVGNMFGGVTEHCFVTGCGQADGATGGGGSVANWCYASTNYTIQYCESSFQKDPKGDSSGFDLDGGSQNCTVQYCYSHDNNGASFIYGTYGGGGATTNNVFRYNISQNDGVASPNSACVRQFGSPTNTTFHNNTFYTDNPAGGAQNLIETTTANFYNNIFYCAVPNVGLFTSVSSGTFAGNIYYFGGGTFSATFNGVTYTSLTSFRAVQETVNGVSTGIFADPLLQAPGLIDLLRCPTLGAYDLQSTSPAIDAALNLLSLFNINPGPYDFHGNAIPHGSSYDIGACEYGASASSSSSGEYFIAL